MRWRNAESSFGSSGGMPAYSEPGAAEDESLDAGAPSDELDLALSLSSSLYCVGSSPARSNRPTTQYFSTMDRQLEH